MRSGIFAGTPACHRVGRSRIRARSADQARQCRRTVRRRRHRRHQLEERHRSRDRGDQRQGRRARPQARSHACGFAVQPRRRARAGAEGARRRALRPARARLFRLGQGHRAARRRSRHRADHGRRGRRTDAGRQQVPVPHLVRPAILDAEGRQIHQRRAEGEIGRDRLGQQRFRQGRPRRHHQGIRQVRHQGRRRHLDRSRPGRFRRRRQQDQGRGARRGVRLSQRGRERAHPQGAEAPGDHQCR